MIYPWHQAQWQDLQALRTRWPHALLVHGPAGIGKVSFAKAMAHALLCETPAADGQACGTCPACHWLAQGNHPDYRLVCPENMLDEAAQEKDQTVNESTNETTKETTKKARAPSKEIKIEQVRSLLDFCSIGAHRGGWRVILLHPAEALNHTAANALLKVLEEPPPKVAFLLVCTHFDRLLPTIVSRCQRWPMLSPPQASALDWLNTQGVEPQLAAAALAQAGGAPLAALESLQNKQLTQWHRFLLDQLAAGANCDIYACAEALQTTPAALVLGWLQRWLYDLSALKTAQRLRYYPDQAAALERCIKYLDLLKLTEYARTVNLQRAVENHPLNSRLWFEELLLAYRSIFNA